MENLIGQHIDRYKILDLLGRGGMATVYKAYDTRLEREVAVKVIRHEAFPPEVLNDALKRFEREAKSLARLSHPNIVKVLGDEMIAAADADTLYARLMSFLLGGLRAPLPLTGANNVSSAPATPKAASSKRDG